MARFTAISTWVWVGMLALSALLVACDEEKSQRPDVGGTDTASEVVDADGAIDVQDADADTVQGPTVVRWRAGSGAPSFGELPFPDDLFLTDADGTISDELGGLHHVASSNLNLLREQIEHLDGFGLSTGVHFFLDGPLDASTLVAGSTALLVDLDALAAGGDGLVPLQVRYLPSLDCITLLPEPGAVLEEGHRHAAVLTGGLLDPDGGAVRADDELVVRLASDNAHASAVEALVAAGVLASDTVVGLAVYTTQEATDELLELTRHVREDLPVATLETGTPPEPFTTALIGRNTSPDLDAWLGVAELDEAGEPWPGFDNPGGIPHDHIAVVYTTTFLSPSFISPESGRFEPGVDGLPIQAAQPARVPVTFVVPNVPPPSASGYPVIIMGHGLRSDRSVSFPRADAFAEAGFVLVGIDDVHHGVRDGVPDVANNFKGTYDGPDGIPDAPSSGMNFFAAFQDMRRIRDHFRQTIVDQVTLIRLLRDSSLDLSVLAAAGGIEAPTLDPDHIYWEGGSLGGMMGTITTAVEPSMRGAALHVPGGNFIAFIATNSALMSSTLQTAVNLVLGVRGDGRIDQFHPLVTLLATAVEPGDPIAYAPLLHRRPVSFAGTEHRPNVLFTYALDDEVMPNVATHALMRAAGVPLVDPLISQPGFDEIASPVEGNWDGVTGAAVQYEPANHGLGWSRYDPRDFLPGHPYDEGNGNEAFPRLPATIVVEMPLREHIAQSLLFLQSELQSGVGRVEITAPARPDFDGDGVNDADEVAAGTDPFDPER